MTRPQRMLSTRLRRIAGLNKEHTAAFNAHDWRRMQSVGNFIRREWHAVDVLREKCADEDATFRAQLEKLGL